MMKRILLWLLAAILLLPILAVAAILVALNTAPGRRLAETQIASLTGNTVQLTGLEGRFPDRLRLAHLAISDATGPYLEASGIVLDWSPLALIHKQALIHRLDAATLSFARLPVSAPAATPAPTKPATPFTLPVRVTIESLSIPKATIGAPLLGTAATLSATGQADLPTLETGTAKLALTRLDAPGGTYTLDGAVTAQTIDATLAITEPGQGLIAQLASLPAIGPIELGATIAGPRDALATTLALTAGPLAAAAKGTVDLSHEKLALDVTANAPAMTPAPGTSWRSIALDAHVTGPFTTPDAAGHLNVDGLQAAGASLQSLAATIRGNAGQVALDATATGLRIPGPNPGLLAAAPLTLQATARLDDPTRPVTFTLAHPLITAKGAAKTGGDLLADLSLPDLTPLAAIGGVALTGHTTLAVHAAQTTTPSGATTQIAIDGPLAITAGQSPIPALIGPDAHLSAAATLNGSDITLTKATITGATLTLAANGSSKSSKLDLTAKLNLSNLALLAPTLTGSAQLDAHIAGPQDNLTLDATLAGPIGAPGIPAAPLALQAHLTGLPAAPTGRLTGTGTFQGAPLALALNAARTPDGTLHATIDRADWRTLHAEGALTLPPGATLPQGRVALDFKNLTDLRPLIGQPLSGALDATIALDPSSVTLDANLRNAGIPGNTVARATIKAKVANPLDHPTVNATLTAEGIATGTATGSARLDLDGPQDALALKTTANLTLAGNPATIAATALLDTIGKQLRLNTLQVDARPPGATSPETLRLLSPATIRYIDGISLDRLRIGLRQATLDVAGRLSPTLDATIALKTPADIAAILSPAYAADGAIALDARLTGTPAQPGGTIKLSATGLRARTGPGRAVPPATIAVTAQLAAGRATIDARLTAGTARLAIAGQAPLGQGPLALKANGTLDLALLDPILTAQGRRARGRITLDTAIAGTTAAPLVSGTAQLANGEIQDFTQNLRINDIAATLRADGQTLRIVSLTGNAGPGTITAAGTVGLGPTLPLDIAITMRNARPLASDQISAQLDADLTLKGPATNGLAAAGTIRIRRADLGIPDNLPASVPTLDVRRIGERQPAAQPAAAPALPITLDLTVSAQQVFVRGHGIDAEMAGTLRIRGSASKPQVGGGLDMRRGSISVAGTTLTFSRGKVGFDGTGVTGKIDPTLDFAADSTSGGVTATLAITGYVSKPKITLTSVPDLPQDEVLAYLVFKRSAKELGPFQIAQIAAGLAELTGVGGGGVNPLDKIRKGLGLDRLSLGSSSNSTSTTSTPTVEAGRYVADGVYVGAKQGTSGNETQATVQIDITKGLKLETDVGSGTGGNQVGLTYQFEY